MSFNIVAVVVVVFWYIINIVLVHMVSRFAQAWGYRDGGGAMKGKGGFTKTNVLKLKKRIWKLMTFKIAKNMSDFLFKLVNYLLLESFRIISFILWAQVNEIATV